MPKIALLFVLLDFALDWDLLPFSSLLLLPFGMEVSILCLFNLEFGSIQPV